jgi:hypothetical protein
MLESVGGDALKVKLYCSSNPAEKFSQAQAQALVELEKQQK